MTELTDYMNDLPPNTKEFYIQIWTQIAERIRLKEKQIEDERLANVWAKLNELEKRQDAVEKEKLPELEERIAQNEERIVSVNEQPAQMDEKVNGNIQDLG